MKRLRRSGTGDQIGHASDQRLRVTAIVGAVAATTVAAYIDPALGTALGVAVAVVGGAIVIIRGERKAGSDDRDPRR